MTRYCANLDGKHAGGLNVCASCARKFREALGSIAVDTPALLLIAARQAGTGDNDRTGVRSRSAHAPLLIREQAWELYCQAEELIRLAALQCGCPPATRRTASVPELVRGILKDDKLLLTASDAREWWRDVVDVAGKVNRMVDHRPRGWRSARARSASTESSGVCRALTWANAVPAARR